jgi:hypothetical protein
MTPGLLFGTASGEGAVHLGFDSKGRVQPQWRATLPVWFERSALRGVARAGTPWGMLVLCGWAEGRLPSRCGFDPAS